MDREIINVLTFNGKNVNDCVKVNGMIPEMSENSKEGKVIIVRSFDECKSIEFNVSGLLENHKKLLAGRYVVLRFRGINCQNTRMALTHVNTSIGERLVKGQKLLQLTPNGEFQGILVDIQDSYSEPSFVNSISYNIHGDSKDGVLEISSIICTDDINEALIACSREDLCIKKTDFKVCDPLRQERLKAEFESKDIQLWFEHCTKKLMQKQTTHSGMYGYTTYMSKNEKDILQFFLSSNTDRSVNIIIDDITNSNGKKLDYELFYEYYHNIDNVMTPDAIPPLTGPIELKANCSQGIYVKISSNKESDSGDYFSLVHILDQDGKEIKKAKFCVHVWNITLSDETMMKTAFALWGNFLPQNNKDLYKIYYDWFLENRINITDLPYPITSKEAEPYLNDCRVNTARTYNFKYIDELGYTPVWKDKIIFYPTDADEPRENHHFKILKERCDEIREKIPDARIIMPYERNIDLTNDGIITEFENSDLDSFNYLSKYINLWCPKFSAYSTHDWDFVEGQEFWHSKKQEEKYGFFNDRIEKEIADGDEMWAYKALTPKYTYTNWLIPNSGTDPIVTLWQCKEYNVTGLLYWAVNFWKVNYWGTEQPWFMGEGYDFWGDGMLVYEGSKFNSDKPISSMRLENVREGIEDYQLLCMLEEKAGREKVDELIDMVSSSCITFTSDDEYLNNVRILLGNTLEKLYQ